MGAGAFGGGGLLGDSYADPYVTLGGMYSFDRLGGWATDLDKDRLDIDVQSRLHGWKSFDDLVRESLQSGKVGRNMPNVYDPNRIVDPNMSTTVDPNHDLKSNYSGSTFMSVGGGAGSGGGHPDFGMDAPNFGDIDAAISGAGISTHGKLGNAMITPGHIGALVQGPDYPGLTPGQWEHESWSPYGTDWGGYLGAPVTNEQRGNRATIEPIGAWNYIDPRQQAIGKHFGIDNPQDATQEDIDALMDEVLGNSSQQSLPDQSVTYNNVVARSLREATAQKKTAARARAKALAKETARLKAKEAHRAQVLKDRAAKKAKEATNYEPISGLTPTPPTKLPPMVIDDPSGPTTHEINVAKRERTKTRLATARGKTKAHLANLRKKGVSAKTMTKARSKAKARYAKIKGR
jgi:hypothetical protein